MIDKEKAEKFGYKEISPYPSLLHAIGLLHTARKVDIKYALSAVKIILNQKFNSYAISVIYESIRDKKEVYVSRTYKDGRQGFTGKLKTSLPFASVEFDGDQSATITEVDAKKTKLSRLYGSLIYTSLSCHFNTVLVFDVTRNTFQMFIKSKANQTRTAAIEMDAAKKP